jgi:hypothetical protein
MTFRPKNFANAVWLFVNRSKVTPNMQHTAVIQHAAYTSNNDRTADNVLVARNDHVA